MRAINGFTDPLNNNSHPLSNPTISTNTNTATTASTTTNNLSSSSPPPPPHHPQKSSISTNAAFLNLPLYLVDIRHDISHNSISPLNTLRFAVSGILAFVKSRYWDVLEIGVWEVIRKLGVDGISLLPRRNGENEEDEEGGGGNNNQNAIATSTTHNRNYYNNNTISDDTNELPSHTPSLTKCATVC